MRTGKRKRLGAILLSAVLIVMQLPVMAMAENNTPEEGSIAFFEPLPSGVEKQTVAVGTELSALQLPDMIRARVYQGTEDTVILDEDSPEEREDTTAASPSDGEDRESEGNDEGQSPVQDMGEATATVTTSEEEIPVTWDSDPSYDGDTQGEYVFTADMGDYVLSDSAKLPTITVIVTEEPVKNEAESQPEEGLPCAKTEGCTLADEHEGDCVTEPENSGELLSCAKTKGCTLADGHEGDCVTEPENSGELLSCVKTEGCTLAAGHEGDCDFSATIGMVSLGDAGISNYDTADVKAFQAILDAHSSLIRGNVKREDPASWETGKLVRWDNSSPKRISILTLNNKSLIGTLDVGNLTTLTELYCGQNQLTELKGLGNLTALTRLNCHSNQLTELKGLKNLTELYCQNNQLTQLDVGNLTDLTVLQCYRNQLSDTLDVRNLTNLTNLTCHDNQLTELQGLGNLTQLTKLTCYNNQLTELQGLEKLTKLTDLSCASNQLSELKGLENLTKLTYLSCENNHLSELKGLGNLTSLTKLYCNDNQLSELKGLGNLTNLTYLECHNNPYRSFTTKDGDTLTVTPAEYGKVWLTSFDKDNNKVELTAKSDSDYDFQEWTGLPMGANVTDNRADFHLNSDITVAAVFRSLGTDTKLKSLSLSSGTLSPAFDPAITSYTATVGNDVSSVTINATANDTEAQVTGDGTKTLNGGSNHCIVTVTAKNGKTKDYTITIMREASTDATLKGLSLSSGTLSPAFAPAITSYTATVGNNVSGVTIHGDANDTKAQVTGDGTKTLNVGENLFTITVTAEDGKTTKDYKVTITRATATNTDATLKDLSLSSGTLSPAFDPAITSYTATVVNSVSSVTIHAEVNDTKAQVTGNGTKTLNVGENLFTITVTAEDGKTTKDYNVTITRAAAKTDATLKGLSLSSGTLSPAFDPAITSGTLSPAFDPAITSYTATVGNSVSSVTIHAEVNDTKAQVTGDGTKTLNVGENLFTITVTAKNGKTKDYTVTITREANTDATLKSLSLSNGTLSPAFAPAITSYTAKVSNSVSSITIHGEVNDTNAKVTGDGVKPLKVGENLFTITVTAKNGKTKDYTVIITRATASSGGGSGSSYTPPKDSYTMTGDSISRSVSRNDLKKLADRGKSLTLSCDKVRMSFQPAALKGILAAVPATVDNITFAAVPADLSGFSDAVAQLSTRLAYDFTISYKDSEGKLVGVSVSFPSGSASVALDYAPAETEVTDRLFMVYVDGKGAVTRLDKSSYAHGEVLADVPHFSIYGVAYKAPEPVAPVFADIENHWAKEDIAFAATRGLLSGTGNNMFSPDSTMTRGMFVTALGRLTDVNANSYQTCSFTDVKTNAYYAAYVEWAVQENIVKGTGDQLFSPDAPVTREQMAVMMTNYAQELGYPIPASGAATRFADNDKISTWAAKEVAAMQQAGIIKGKDGNRFDPQGNATRAEVAAVLHWFVEIVIDPVE